MVVDSSSVASAAHRLIAFIYFTCAAADADWQNQETVALYELLEAHAEGRTREQSVALAQEAYQSWLALADQAARVRHIEAEAGALAHLTHAQRDHLFDDIRGLFRTDGEVTRPEVALLKDLREIVRAVPHRPDTSVRDSEVRLLAFIYFTFAAADGRWQSEETIALYDALERHTGVADGAREYTISLAQDAYRSFKGVPADDRIAWLGARIPAVLAHRDAAARKQILQDLVDLARADGKFSPSEGHVLEDIRALLLGPPTLGV